MNEGDVSDGFAKGEVERFGTFLWVNVNARSSDRKPVGSRSKVTNFNFGEMFVFWIYNLCFVLFLTEEA